MEQEAVLPGAHGAYSGGRTLQGSGLMGRICCRERECLFPNSYRLAFLLSLPASFITMGRFPIKQAPQSISCSRHL